MRGAAKEEMFLRCLFAIHVENAPAARSRIYYGREVTMKLFHLSDLHIGKRVNEFSMLEDQKYILTQILKAAKEHQPDGIILAGDIYDKPVPAAEAVQVFDDFLTSLNEMGLTVFMISGNHDSPERVSYGGRLMKKSGIYVAPVYEGKTEKVEMEKCAFICFLL